MLMICVVYCLCLFLYLGLVRLLCVRFCLNVFVDVCLVYV